jgi:hypothetical protein
MLEYTTAAASDDRSPVVSARGVPARNARNGVTKLTKAEEIQSDDPVTLK